MTQYVEGQWKYADGEEQDAHVKDWRNYENICQIERWRMSAIQVFDPDVLFRARLAKDLYLKELERQGNQNK